jgi:hypothetical protein
MGGGGCFVIMTLFHGLDILEGDSFFFFFYFLSVLWDTVQASQFIPQQYVV